MTRKSFIITIVALFAIFDASAKKKKEYPRTEIKVEYSYPHKRLKTDAKAYDDEYTMLLLSNGRYSKFFSPRTEFNDSLHSTPSGKRIWDRMLHEGIKKYTETGDESAMPYSKGALYVFKSAGDSTVTVYDSAGMLEYGYYSEPLAEMKWEISDSAKTILGYDCVMAETDYHGRHWTVWFTPDIPIQDGPWKLCGLPGLILEATEPTGQHKFTATGIESSNQEIFPIYLPKKYDKMTRKEMLRSLRQYLTNGTSMFNALISNTPSGEKIEIKSEVNDAPDLHVDFLETDYHE
ncbi:MAG: GLPGLI family protein [Bacteroides sp.]|nr:GLPGLI family protein [Bacteroides sp.]